MSTMGSRPTTPSDDETVKKLDVRTLQLDDGDGYQLVVSTREGVSVVALTPGRSFTIGRGAECDVVSADPTLSREHARIHVGEVLSLEDLGSTNGTRIAGKRLEPGSPFHLRESTPFEAGSVSCVILRAHVPSSASARGLRSDDDDDGPVLEDAAMRRVFSHLDVLGPASLNILVLGETGTGKEVFAVMLHRASSRATKPFVQLNCAALSESILESELFGYERGAFTGAVQAKAGLFEAADGGMLMLDELGDMPPAMQAKLLRVLETGDVMRVGAVKARKVDVRIVAATHKDLRQEVAAGRFRADLFFRLNGMSILLPPLRDRPADLRPLAERFARAAASKLGRPAPALSDAAAARLASHGWPGNVRELRNVIERAVVMAKGNVLTPLDLVIDGLEVQAARAPDDARVSTANTSTSTAAVVPPSPLSPPSPPPSAPQPPASLRDALDGVEYDRIVGALKEAGGNQSRAAALLGISRYALMARMDRYKIVRPRKP